MTINAPFERNRRLPDTSALDSILGTVAERLRRADPRTERDWDGLRMALERSDVRSLRRGIRLRPSLAFGVAVLVFVIAGLVLFRPGTHDVSYSTGKGELSTVLLPDSSEVTLNHTSELLVGRRGGWKSRHVALTGEAFFRVRPGSDPFIVATEAGAVRVVGTQFNVRVRGGQMEVAVVSGTVRVTCGPDTGRSVELQAGSMVRYAADGVLSSPEPILFADYPGWIHRKLLFQRSTLLAACTEIEAHFDVRVRIDNPALMNETITGALDSRSAESAVAALAALTGSRYSHDANGYSLH